MTDLPPFADSALPQDDEDVSFDAPWQARVFGLVVALYHQGERDWDTFQQRLVERLDGIESVELDADVENVYYREWLAALEDLVDEEGVCAPGEIDRRQTEFREGERDASEFVSGDTTH